MPIVAIHASAPKMMPAMMPAVIVTPKLATQVPPVTMAPLSVMTVLLQLPANPFVSAVVIST